MRPVTKETEIERAAQAHAEAIAAYHKAVMRQVEAKKQAELANTELIAAEHKLRKAADDFHRAAGIEPVDIVNISNYWGSY